MSLLQLLLLSKYEIEKTFRKIRNVFVSNHKDAFEPLDMRRNTRLDKEDYLYSLKMQYCYGWLCKYSNQLDETISVLLTDKYRKNLFRSLIRKFKYVDRDTSQNLLNDIASVIQYKWRCNPNDSVIMAIRKMSNPHPDGSMNIIYRLQDLLKDWKSSRFINVFDLDNKYVKNSKNIILCDDFIGTGGTMGKRIDDLYNVISSSQTIYLISIAGMKEARTNVLDQKKITYFAPIWLDKGFSTDTPNEDCTRMLQMEDLLAKKYKEYTLETMSLGYNKSGGLYYNEDYRIPNNVFPIFWWGKLRNDQPFKSIFLRS